MSARDGIDIPIKTTLDGRGLTQAEAAIKKVTQAVNPWVTATKSATAAQSQQETEVKAAARAIEQLGEKHETAAGKQEKVAGSSRNMGNAMLQASRAVDDAQYGIAGVVNNLEGLAMALGMGTGVAGAATVAAVALNTLIKNWDKLFAATENKPDWTQLTPDEEAVKRLDDYNRGLERQAELLDRIGKARRETIKAQQEEDDANEKRKALWADLMPNAKDALPPLPGTEPLSPELRRKERGVSDARETTAQAVANAVLKDREFQAQQKIVQDTEKRQLLTRQFQEQQAADRVKLWDYEGADSDGGIAAFSEEIAALKKVMADRAAKFAQQTQGLTGPNVTQALTGDVTKDEETLRNALNEERQKLSEAEQRRNAAAVQAQETYAPLNEAERAFNSQQQFEQEQRSSSAFKELGLPPPPGVAQGADAAAGLPQNDASVVQSFAGRVSAGAEQNKALLEQATTKLEGLNTEGAKAMTTMATLITGLIENQRSLAAMLQSQSGDVSAVKQQLDSFRK